jgi:RecJ-like exonuclease
MAMPSSEVIITVLLNHNLLITVLCRAIVQVVTRRLPTAAARVRVQVSSCGIRVYQVVLEQVFSEYFGFPCQFSFHQLIHTQNLSSWAGTIG